MSEGPTRIFLTGFSGTGKSTVGELVAKKLGWEAVDTDALIGERAGKSPADVINEDGEARFRELERDVIEEVATRENIIVALGGGAIVAKENRLAISSGLVVALDAMPQALLDRLGHETAKGRPMLSGDDTLNRIIELKAQRQRYYALADFVIETDDLKSEDVASRIVGAISEDNVDAGPERFLLPEEHSNPTASNPITVTPASRKYDVHVGWGALDRLGELVAGVGLSGKAFIVSDSDVLPRYGDRALFSLRSAGFDAESFAIPAGEASKTLSVAATVYDWLVEHRAERVSPLIALGGGVVGDLGGFVAATYLRGMPLVQVPTSLLAMVDASLGGKTAVDHKEGKNLIGSFYQPRLVVDDVSVLKTLPRRALVEGCAETIKHALILDEQLLADLEARADDLLHLEPAFAVDIVCRNVAIKGAIVSEDETESGRRALLNYGHTTGHAIEAVTGYAKVLHGEAVAAGMMVAAKIGRRINVTPPELVDRQQKLLERFGLPTRGPKLNVDDVLQAMTLDKKVKGGKVTWVLLEGPGRAVLRSDVPDDVVRDALSEVLS